MYWIVVEVRNRVLSAVPPCHVTLSELWSAKSDLSLYSQWLLHGKTCRLLGSSEAVGLPMKSHKMGWAQTLTFGCESFWHGGHSVGAQLSGDAHWIYGNSCLGKNKKQTQNKTKKNPTYFKGLFLLFKNKVLSMKETRMMVPLSPGLQRCSGRGKWGVEDEDVRCSKEGQANFHLNVEYGILGIFKQACCGFVIVVAGIPHQNIMQNSGSERVNVLVPSYRLLGRFGLPEGKGGIFTGLGGKRRWCVALDGTGPDQNGSDPTPPGVLSASGRLSSPRRKTRASIALSRFDSYFGYSRLSHFVSSLSFPLSRSAWPEASRVARQNR